MQFFYEKIWQINQGGQGVWFGARNTPEWRIYLNVSILLIKSKIDSLFCSP
jgi:hypothetical protein